jgi:hypothetical protein
MARENINMRGRGARGESFADVARRLGSVYGEPIDPDATDQEALDAVAAAAGAPVAAAVVIAAFQPFMDEAYVGRPGEVEAGADVSTGQFVFGNARQYFGQIKKVYAQGGAAGGDLSVRIYSRAGNVFTMVQERVVEVAADTPEEFVAGVDFADDFIYFPGSYLGFYSVANTVATTAEAAESGGWYNSAVDGTFTDATPNTGNDRLQVGFLVEEASNTGADAPLSIVAGGNSLTEDPFDDTPWTGMLAAEMGITVANEGVSGQTISQMLTLFDEQIAPYAVQPGFRTVAILDGEPYNEMILNSTSVSASVDKMAQWCNAARAAGFNYVGVVNSAAHNTSDDTVEEGSWNRLTTKDLLNAEIASRWPDFADFLVDIGSSPAFVDYAATANTTYYRADRQHYETPGQTIVMQRVRQQLALIR